MEGDENDSVRFATRRKVTVPETASPEDSGSLTVVPSTAGINVLKNLDNAIAELENKPNNTRISRVSHKAGETRPKLDMRFATMTNLLAIL